jgi:aminocarboxymuconate-semialdehyde decarboxylase
MNGAIDVHTHILPPRWDDWAARFGGKNWPRLVGDPTTQCQLYLGETLNRNLGPDSFDPVRRIADMDKTGIERQVLSPPRRSSAIRPTGSGGEFCRMQNDNIAASWRGIRTASWAARAAASPDLAVKELDAWLEAQVPVYRVGGNVDGGTSMMRVCTRVGGGRCARRGALRPPDRASARRRAIQSTT